MKRDFEMLILFLGCTLVLLLVSMLSVRAYSAEMECYTDEPKVYIVDLKDQKKGTYYVETEWKSGPKAGIINKLLIKDVAKPDPSDDYFVKQYTTGNPYRITYALYCRKITK